MKKTVLSIVIMLFCVLGYTQDLPKIVPLSPNAAEIAKYGEIPISHFTGVPNIGVPIYTVKSGDLTLPLSLSYHAGGNKVESIASWVGLGWSLGTIPSISRSVRGIPDEEGGYFYLYSGKTVKELWDIRNSNEALFNTYRQDLYSGLKDSEPDIFYYNLPGESGKFFWNQEANSFITYPKSNIKITRDDNVFTLVTEDGVEYLMNIIETNRPNGGNPTRTTWYASKMTAANKKDVIEFKYRYEYQIIKTYNTVTKYHFLSGVSNGTPDDNGSILSTSTTNAQMIEKIIFSNGYINFNESNNYREDLQNGKRLSNISIYNNLNQLISKYQFIHRYKMGSGSTSGASPCYNAESYVKKWMLLDKLERISNDNTDKQVHSFSYNEANFPACRRSAGQDYWGYYNGHDENSSLIPTYSLPTNGAIISGADRSVDPNKSQFGILNKITYPTGGYTEFYYENNKVRNDDIIPPQYRKAYQAMDGGDIFEWGEPLNETHTEVRQFTINNPPDKRLNGDNPNGGALVKFTIMQPGCDLSNGVANNCARFTIKGSLPGSSTIDITFPGKTLYLPNDNYEMKASFNQNPPEYGSFLFLAEWEILAPTQTNENRYAGGVRIKEIKSYAHANATPLIKKYKYTTEYNSTTSSGDIFVQPVFGNEKTIVYDFVSGSPPHESVERSTLFRVQSFSNMQNVTYSGSPVGYAKVFEFTDDSNQTGYSEYSFSSARDESGVPEFPYPPAESMEHERGKLLESVNYKKSGSNFEKVERKRFTYTTSPYQSSSQYPKSSFAIKWGNDFISNSTQVYGYAQNLTPYYATGGWRGLYSETTEDFSDNNTVFSSKRYSYDNAAHLLKTGITATNSKGEVLKTETKYAYDVNDTRLINEHRIAEPLEIKNYKGNDLLNYQKTVYDSLHTPSNLLYLPSKVKTLKGGSNGTNSLEDRVVYHKYDNVGNLLDVSLKEGPHIAYLWGYNGQYPIAKIENVTSYSSIPSALITAAKNASNNGSESDLTEALNDIREALPDARVTTYTHKPLIGVSTITDPRGEKTTYTYDTFNRLEFIKDETNKLLEAYKYHYKN
ncbi:hypothetical protein LS482_09735 [Sinomicrobium kalidii]|uniref:hypothetical protein n=1 Tax=Sinomicrobium kalidii TaxID=2900738 RepID=UPI001E543076|nr:hypothetical protein [Sinomicrobium kalidii]UGU18148.1 hypothetical protein LS482_09735 [Sinomicrobium kalidii]